MEATVLVCLATAIVCALLTLDGAVCLAGVDNVCILNGATSIVMLIIGAATLVPVLAALYTAWLDHHLTCLDERTRLLETGNHAPPKRVLMYLYVSHFLSSWGDNMWQFAVPILFMEVFVDTLLPSATFSLVMYTTCLVAIPSVGNYLDASNRWWAMKFAIVLENFVIVLSTVVLGLILSVTNADGTHKPEWTPTLLGLFGVMLVCGGVGQVLSEAQTLAIERDWVVVLAGDDSDVLAHLNTTMRRVDLSCTILAPMVFGIIMDFAGDEPTTRAMTGAAVVGIWNLLSMPLEYYMTRDIYDLTPVLAVKAQHTEAEQFSDTKDTSTVKHYATMWRDYVHHPVFLLSLAFCTLYMTILNNSALNTAYLKWRGIPDSVLGLSRGASAVAGLVGTFVFPKIRNLLGGRVESVAVMSVWLFWLCLMPVLVAFVVAGESRTSDYAMLGCIAASRMWLWSNDLAETQIMQEWIEPHRRGAINAMQTATYQCFYIVIQCLGIVFHDPRQFEALVLFSLATVFLSAVGFTVWDYRYGCHRDLYVHITTLPLKMQ